MDWNELRERAEDAQLTTSFLAQNLPPDWVAQVKMGLALEVGYDGRAIGQCPFHDDADPSFACYDARDGRRRWGCWSCQVGGDVLDLIARHERCGVLAAIDTARRWWREYELSGMPAPTPKPAEERHLPEGTLTWYQQADFGPTTVAGLMQLGAAKGWDWLNSHDEATAVANRFRIKRAERQLLVPHFSMFDNGVVFDYELRGLKTRTVDGKGRLTAVHGSRLDQLYGLWNLNMSNSVILCEGESDTWCAHLAFPQTALGLPAGASSYPKFMEQLRNRRVLLAFDGDAAGDFARERWGQLLRGVAAEVHVGYVERGLDLAKLGPEALKACWGAFFR